MDTFYWLAALLFVSGSSLAGPDHTARETATRHERYLRLLRDYFSQPRHAFDNEDNWLRARQGVVDEFNEITARVGQASVEIHKFKSEVTAGTNVQAPVDGENVIVTFRGQHYDTDMDSVLVIGAHYDSDSGTNGIDDNGSGVVALLEVARHLSAAIADRGAQLLDTVIFVAFDVQKYEHESPGNLDFGTGSTYFVQERLDPILSKNPPPEFRGAIVLDSVLNFNDTAGSQVLPFGFDLSFKEAHEFITKNNNTGNFLTMVTKERLRTLALDQFFQQQWNTVNPEQSRRSPLVTLEIRRALQSEASFHFLKQDHLAFWNYVKNNVPHPLPAVLITDTGKFRGMPRLCQTSPCDVAELVNEGRLALLDHVVMTIDQFLLVDHLDDFTTAQPGEAASHVTSLVAMATALLAAIFLH